MTINLQLPEKQSLKPSITVFGVGGGGSNAVCNMLDANLEGVRFVVANTDAQSLDESPVQDRIQLGESITQGLGAGSYPEVGKASAEEATDEVLDYLQGSNMVFITAGLGGGTGTGAAPVVARLAREQGILTVAVVTKPFHFEGTHRMRVAELGLQELAKFVDTLIVIPNQNLFRIADKNTTFMDAFKMADEVLHAGVRGITDLMVMPGMINLDFADVRSVMSEMGKAMMGTGEGSGEQRAVEAAEAAIANPLLDNVSMQGARGVLINITGGPDMTLFEVDEAANRIREEVDPDANIIFGSTFDQNLDGVMRVSVVATGIDLGIDEGNSTKDATQEEDYKAPSSFLKTAPTRPVTAIQKSAEREAAEADESEQQTAAEAEGTPSKPASGLSNPFGNDKTQPEAAAAKPETDAENDDDEGDSEAFISPAPSEPRQQPAAIDFSKKEDSFALSSSGSEQGDAPEYKSHSSFLSGIFSHKREDAPQAAAESKPEKKNESSASATVTSRQPEKELVLEDDLDVPAFLRRKQS